MRKPRVWAACVYPVLVLVFALAFMGCDNAVSPTAPAPAESVASAAVPGGSAVKGGVHSTPHPSCWGQASQVFAQMGNMGPHSSQQETPRVGLRNLARELYEAGVIEDDSMASLGAFVAAALGLSIDACM